MHTRIVILLCTTLSLTACDASVSLTGNDTQQDGQSTQLRFEIVRYQQQGGPDCPDQVIEAETPGDDTDTANSGISEKLCATVELSYPRLSSDAKPELAVKLNDFIMQQMVDDPERNANETITTPQQFADSFINEYKQTPTPFTSWELERDMTIEFTTRDVLTLLLGEFGHTGGAHPFSGQRYSVLSLEDAQPVTLADLLDPGYEAPLNVAGEKIFRVERKLKEEETLEEQGFSFPNDVFSVNDNFGVLKEGLDFIFNSYEIAPYALGPTQFTIPYEDIQGLIRPDGPLGQSVN